ncbi:hypothetical protein BUE93_21970 [Chromobacterium amazonense]|uniref:MobA/VirD2-like nuclease domain-containing protein n=1 Tax=Chromobacterium amazonense TaxID=1382803 RepID=A0A2S9WYD2_9NEIS|nr:MobP1 family relaxase [Chromobacterium amazonense]PRP68473.1 hypothetical protein BUE93_21970 [Chromobacterium amazonense]
MSQLGVFVDREWRVKKARNTHAAISTFAYKIRRQISEASRKSNETQFRGYLGQRFSTEVMVKITGGCKSRQQLKRKVDYDSREYTLPMMDEHGNLYEGEEEIKAAFEHLAKDGEAMPILHGEQLDEAKKQTHNMMFSAPKSVCVPQEEMMESVRETLNKRYPNNTFLLAYHNDSGNPHVHALLKIPDASGKRIRMTKAELREIRTSFCDSLKRRGHEVTATYRHDQKREYALKKERAVNQYTVTEFGEAHYQFNEDKAKSYFVKYQTANGKESTIWGVDLKARIAESQVQVGDRVTIRKVESEPIQVPMYDKAGTVTHYKAVHRNAWEISNLSRDVPNHTLTQKPVPSAVDAEKRDQHLRNRAMFDEAKSGYFHDSGDKRKIADSLSPPDVSVSDKMPEGLSFRERVEWRKQHKLQVKAEERGVDVSHLAENQVMPDGLSFREKAEWRKNNAMLQKAQKLGVNVSDLAENQVMPDGLSLKERSDWRAQNAKLKRAQEQVLKQSQGHGMSLSIKIKRE